MFTIGNIVTINSGRERFTIVGLDGSLANLQSSKGVFWGKVHVNHLNRVESACVGETYLPYVFVLTCGNAIVGVFANRESAIREANKCEGFTFPCLVFSDEQDGGLLHRGVNRNYRIYCESVQS